VTVGPITSAANPRIRAVARLRERRARDLAGLTLLDGPREILLALRAGVALREAFVSPRADAQVLAELGAAGVPLVAVSEAVGARIGYGERDSGVVVVASTPSTSLDDLRPPAAALIVVAEGIEKPGNLGAILRSADAVGADALIAADARTDPFNPNAVRASLGSIFSVPIAAAPSVAVLAWLRERSIQPVAARVDAALTYTDADLTGGIALVVGAEDIGLSDTWRGSDVLPVRLPMRGTVDSLNVSVATAVLLFEARRQRTILESGAGSDRARPGPPVAPP
jgi:TrmH family RNA methyltransferase